MLGIKINDFDNSDGIVKTFNKIFPKTPLKGSGDVEILGIVERKVLTENSTYVRLLKVNEEIVEHDFGENNFYNNEDFLIEENIRFKYYARDLNGKLLATAYNCSSLASKLKCKIGIVKNRLVNVIDNSSNSKYKFNVTRIEL